LSAVRRRPSSSSHSVLFSSGVNTAYPESRPAHDAIAKASGDERHQEANDQRDTATKDHPLGSVTISIPS